MMIRFLGRGSAFADEHNCAYFTAGADLVLLDCPMSAFTKLKQKDIKAYENIYVLITHTHGDHIGGVAMLIDYVHFVFHSKVTVAAPSEQVKNDLKYWLSNLEGCGDDWYDMILASDIKKDWMGEAIPTTHAAQLAGKCFGYRLILDGNTVIYTGDSNTLAPYEKYLVPGVYLYTEVSAYKTEVHLYCGDIKEKVRSFVEQGIHVYLMHMDDETVIRIIMEGTGAEFAPLEEDTMNGNGTIMDAVFGITDSLYKDMCMNKSKDHGLLFSYLTKLSMTLVNADRASFWKWDKRKHVLWTMTAIDVDKIEIPDDKGLVGKALRTEKTVVTNDPYSDPDFNSNVDKQTGYVTKSVLVLPVADVNGNFIGALQLLNKLDGTGFDEVEDVKKLSLAALVCGIALESETFLQDSHHDRLTGLKNRMGFFYDFGGEFKDYLDPNAGKTMSVFICDIDKFKRVNDTYGHNAGDDVLSFTANLIESFCGEKESVYRWGGEEFVMVLRDTDLEGAAAKAEEIRVKLMNSDIDAEGTIIRCTLSFGVALFDPKKTIEENISVADARLYTAKETGRNRVCKEDV